MSELFYKDGEAKTFKRFCSERLCSECELYADANGDCQKAYTIVLEKEIRADERAKVVDEAIKILRENALISAMGKIERLKEQNND